MNNDLIAKKIQVFETEKSEFMEDKADEQQKDNYRSHYRNNRSNTLECCFYKCLKQHGWNWNRNMSGYIFWYIWQSYFFKKNKDK